MTSRGPFRPKTFYDSVILCVYVVCPFLFVAVLKVAIVLKDIRLALTSPL